MIRENCMDGMEHGIGADIEDMCEITVKMKITFCKGKILFPQIIEYFPCERQDKRHLNNLYPNELITGSIDLHTTMRKL